MVVDLWIYLNISGITKFDPYPFILLNLAFSLQAAYAAPLYLHKHSQSERDQAYALADVQNREDLAEEMTQRQAMAEYNTQQLFVLLQRIPN